VQCWQFTLEPTSVVLAAGESLRLEIASSAFPLYDRNPSTDVAPQDADNWNWQRSTQQIAAHGGASFGVHLPIEEGADGEFRASVTRAFPEIALDGVSKQFRSGALALAEHFDARREGRVCLAAGAVGMRQIYAAAAGLRADSGSSGSVAVNGMTPVNARELMSFIFQDATLLPWRTVEQNVGLGTGTGACRAPCA
jgi:hypothetical protein